VYPRTNREFWGSKLKKNAERDIAQTGALRSAGWIPLRFWEHEVWSDLSGVVNAIMSLLSTGMEPRRENWRLIEVQVVDPEREYPCNRSIQRCRQQQLRRALG
jgi:G:T-mismatch repair DNA endonuclease (very short patch repair protein)